MNELITEELEYVNKNVDPILSKMLIKIINENPPDLVEYMISYLKKEEESLNDN